MEVVVVEVTACRAYFHKRGLGLVVYVCVDGFWTLECALGDSVIEGIAVGGEVLACHEISFEVLATRRQVSSCEQFEIAARLTKVRLALK